MAWIPLTLPYRGLAAVYGEYDLLVIVTCAIPALIFFAINYAMSISAFLPDDGHTFHDIIGVYPPFDFVDQPCIWANCCFVDERGSRGHRVKARRFKSPQERVACCPYTVRRLTLVALDGADLGLIVFVLCAILLADLRGQLRLGSPSFSPRT